MCVSLGGISRTIVHKKQKAPLSQKAYLRRQIHLIHKKTDTDIIYNTNFQYSNLQDRESLREFFKLKKVPGAEEAENYVLFYNCCYR